jgi:acetyl-CoA carboxylase biotin carboxyl carrier protein
MAREKEIQRDIHRKVEKHKKQGKDRTSVDIKEIETIIRILKQNDVTDFELDQDGTRIKLTRLGGGQPYPAPTYQVTHQVTQHEMHPAVAPLPAPSTNGNHSKNAATEQTIPSTWVKVESPIVGTFYRKPSPDADFFVSEGDRVKKGDTLCIVEAMKLMNEIEATCDGKVERILLTDGQVVEYGEVLLFINPAA